MYEDDYDDDDLYDDDLEDDLEDDDGWFDDDDYEEDYLDDECDCPECRRNRGEIIDKEEDKEEKKPWTGWGDD